MPKVDVGKKSNESVNVKVNMLTGHGTDGIQHSKHDEGVECWNLCSKIDGLVSEANCLGEG